MALFSRFYLNESLSRYKWIGVVIAVAERAARIEHAVGVVEFAIGESRAHLLDAFHLQVILLLLHQATGCHQHQTADAFGSAQREVHGLLAAERQPDRITGRIERINPVVDPTTRQVRIYVSIPNVNQGLAAGLFAEGRVATDTKRAVAVPVGAVDSRGTSPTVHLIKQGRVTEVAVRLGVRDEAAELVEVVSGVAEGDTVLLGSAQGLTSGSRVQVLRQEARR